MARNHSMVQPRHENIYNACPSHLSTPSDSCMALLCERRERPDLCKSSATHFSPKQERRVPCLLDCPCVSVRHCKSHMISHTSLFFSIGTHAFEAEPRALQQIQKIHTQAVWMPCRSANKSLPNPVPVWWRSTPPNIAAVWATNVAPQPQPHSACSSAY